MTTYIYTQSITVHDIKSLVDAARAHPDAQGIPVEDFYDADGDVNAEYCLAMLMDPGSLPGCRMHNHTVEWE